MRGSGNNDASVLRWPPSPADLEHADEALRDLLEHEQQQGKQLLDMPDQQGSRKRRRWQPAVTQRNVTKQTFAYNIGPVLTPQKV